MAQHTWEFMAEQAADAKGFNAKQLAIFEYFNPNGAWAYKQAADKKISEAVDNGLVPSGWLLAYGSFNDYHYEKLSRLVRQQTPSRRKVEYYARCLREEADKATARLAAHLSNSASDLMEVAHA